MKRWHPLAVTTCGLALLSTSLTGLLSQAATETCQGLPVTGTTGTDGDDVLLINTADYRDFSAGAGNDVICIVGDRLVPDRFDPRFSLDAGPGDDIVENRATVRVGVMLGNGKDTYSGSETDDYVFTGGSSTLGGTKDTEVDQVSTNGGDDLIYSGSVVPGIRNEDIIDTGIGRDHVGWSGSGGTIINGPTPDELEIDPYWLTTTAISWTGDVVVDNSTRRATSGSEVLLTWTNVDDFYLPASIRLTAFTGTDMNERLRLGTPARGPFHQSGSRPTSTWAVAMTTSR